MSTKDHVHTMVPYEDCWDDLYEISDKRAEQIAQEKDDRNVTKTYVKEAIKEALNDFAVDSGVITPAQVDEKIANAIKNISATDISGIVSQDELENAIKDAVEEIKKEGYLLPSDLEGYPTKDDIKKLEKAIDNSVAKTLEDMQAELAKTYATKTELDGYPTIDEIKDYVKGELDSFVGGDVMDKRVTKVEENIESMETSISVLDSSVTSIEESISIIDSSISEAETRLAKNEEDIETLTQCYESTVDVLEKMSGDITDVSTYADDISSNLNDVSIRLDAISDRTDIIDASIVNLDAKLDASVAEVNTKIDNAEKSITDTISEVNNIKENISELSDSVSVLSKHIDDEFAEVHKDIDEIDASIELLDSSVTILTSSVQSLDDRLNETETTLGKAVDDITTNRDRIISVEDTLKTTDANVAENTESITTLTNDLKDTGDKLDNLKNALDEFKETVDEDYASKKSVIDLEGEVENINDVVIPIICTDIKKNADDITNIIKRFDSLVAGELVGITEEQLNDILVNYASKDYVKEQLAIIMGEPEDGNKIPEALNTIYEIASWIQEAGANHADKSALEIITSEITNIKNSIEGIREDYVDKTELQKYVKKSELDIPDVTGLITEKEVDDKIESATLNAIKYKDFGYNGIFGRKTIELANYDTISGLDSAGTGHNLVMLSKWNIADFGSTGVHFNINTLDTVTINDDEHVATEEFVNENYQRKGNYLTEHQSLADYFKKDDADRVYVSKTEMQSYAKIIDVNSALDKKAEKSVVTELKKSIGDINDNIDLIEDSIDTKADAVKVLDISTKVNDIRRDYLKKEDIEGLASEDNVDEKIASAMKMAVEYKEFVGGIEPDIRKTIQLDNFDSISGKDTKGKGYNLVMVSKWNVADFGSTGIPFNINTSDKVTINDNQTVATEEYVAEKYMEKTDVESTYVSNESLKETLADYLKISDEVSLDGYATEEFVGNEISKAVDGKVTQDDIDKSLEIYEKTSDVDAKIQEAVDNTMAEVEKLTNPLASKDEVDNAIESATKMMVEYKDFVGGITNIRRKTIQLDNFDSISGIDTSGKGHNLVMLSQWNVADFGATGVHFNINTLDNATINDKFIIATQDYVDEKYVSKETYETDSKIKDEVEGLKTELTEAIENKADKSDVESMKTELVDEIDKKADKDELESTKNALSDEIDKKANISDIETFVSSDDIDARIAEAVDKSVKYKEFVSGIDLETVRKTIQLDNFDSISGIDTSGNGHNLVMLSKWNVADFGAKGVHFNINTSDNVTINDDEIIATQKYVESKYISQVDFAESTKNVVEYMNFTQDGIDRKSIRLSNFDTISSETTKGKATRLLMLSNKNIAEFGSTTVHFNINTKDNATINDTDIIATQKFVADSYVSNASLQDTLKDYLKSSDEVSLDGYATEEFVTDNYVSNINLEEILKDYLKSSDGVYLEGYATEEFVNNAVEDKVDKKDLENMVEYKEFVGGSTDIVRKTIQLDNFDSISGVDTNGKGHNLVMLSQWDVADFGATGVHFNINTSDTVTINDVSVIATLDDVNDMLSGYITESDAVDKFITKDNVNEIINVDVIKDEISTVNKIAKDNSDKISALESGKVDKDEIKDFISSDVIDERIATAVDKSVKYKEFVGGSTDIVRKTIQLDNFDSISGIDTDGNGHNLVMLSMWNVADFGATGVHFNINTKDNVTINDKDVIATVEKDINPIIESVKKVEKVVLGEEDKEGLEERIDTLETELENANKLIEALAKRIDEIELESTGKIECIDKPGNFENIEDSEDTDILANNQEYMHLFSAANNPSTYKTIGLSSVETDESLKLSAVDSVNVHNLTINSIEDGNKNAIMVSAPAITIDNLKIAEDCDAYNIVECDKVTGIESIDVINLEIVNPNLTHNIINVYKPADNAVITISDCKFLIDAMNTNPLRLSNIGNAENVTVVFDNVEWTYVESDNYDYAGLVLYQPYGSDLAYSGDVSIMKTWKFVFRNCKYNGEKVTDINFGQENCVMYCYAVNKKQSENPLDYGFDIIFE